MLTTARQSNEREVIEALGDNFWEWDIISGDVRIAADWAREMGYSVAEMTEYARWKAMIHHDDWPLVSDAIDACLDGTVERYDCEFRMQQANGAFIWIRSRARVTEHTADGRPKRMLGAYENIDSRKGIEQALRDAEMRWSFALEGSGDGVWDWDLTNNKVYFSAQWKAMFGFTEDEIDNNIEEWRRLALPEDLERSDAAIARYLNGEIDEYSCECRARCKDGSIKWILDRGKFVAWDEDGSPTRMIGTHQDITSKKNQTDALRKSQEQLERITSLVPGMVYEYELRDDGTSCFHYASAGIKRIYGITPAVAQNDAAAVFDVIAEGDRERVRESILASARDGNDWKEEFRVTDEQGAARWLMGHATPVYGPDTDGTVRWYGHIGDITELKRATQQLQQQALELRATNRELEDFAYIASHDLQEPLRKIQAYSDRLVRKCASELAAPEQADLAKIISAATRMRNLIDALLDLSRVTFDMSNFERVDMNDVIGDVLGDLEVTLSDARATISHESLPSAHGNRTLLCRLMQNLLVNACKFRRPDVALRITISAQAKEGGSGGSNPRITIMVADNGIGIEDSHAEIVFKPLQRLHAREAYEGTGIGLAVCRKIVSAHGGEITVLPNDDGGATFAFDLELAP